MLLIIATIGIVSTAPGFTLFGLVSLPTDDSGGLFGTAAEKAYIGYGLLVGLAFGPVQASSRSYLARSVSADEAGRYFGIYALAGRATSFTAPFSVATVTALSGSAPAGMAMIALFLLAGLIILLPTPYPADKKPRNGNLRCPSSACRTFSRADGEKKDSPRSGSAHAVSHMSVEACKLANGVIEGAGEQSPIQAVPTALGDRYALQASDSQCRKCRRR